jgi:prolyl-tRNA synthetase
MVQFVAELVVGVEKIEKVVTAVFTQTFQINETKLGHVLDAQRLRPTAEQATDIWVVDDGVHDWTGQADVVADIVAAQEGDACTSCGQPLRTVRAVEVANIFKLGTRYSRTMGATFVDEQDEAQPIVMGSYGIGVTRLLACLAEHHHDGAGLVWPVAIAPYAVHLLALRGGEETAVSLYQALQLAGVEVLFDDREARPGVKFNDADLIGLPLRLTVSERSLAAGGVEVKVRAGGETAVVPLDKLVNHITNWLAEQ